MIDRPFPDKSNPPTGPALQAALGDAYSYYEEITGLASAYAQDWTFFKSSGWILKVHARKKALLYVIPLHAGFKVNLTIREKERELFLQDEALGYLQEKLSGAKKYPEGFALQFEVAGASEFQPLEVFVRKLIAVRG